MICNYCGNEWEKAKYSTGCLCCGAPRERAPRFVKEERFAPRVVQVGSAAVMIGGGGGGGYSGNGGFGGNGYPPPSGHGGAGEVLIVAGGGYDKISG